MKALFTGATGFIGSSLMSRVEQRVVLTRNVAAAQKKLERFNPQVYAWNAEKEAAPVSAFAGVDTIFHLAGEPVAEGRWTEDKKKRLRDSRILGTRNLIATLRKLNDKPKVLVAASAVGIYGDRGEEILTEAAASANDFLADLCRDWEAEAHTAASLGIRVVSIRSGIVLGAGGGALQKMLTPFRLGVGSALGSGKQYMPWIHLHDLADLFMFAAEHENIEGPVNGTSPNPVSNSEFTKTLGKTLGMPTFFPAVPGFALKLMFGEFGNILLHSQRVMPHKALNAGFQFRYSELAPALANILAK